MTLSRLLKDTSCVSADMAYRLADAFGTSPELWAGMQSQYDLYQAGKIKRPKIEKFSAEQTSIARSKYVVLTARDEVITNEHVYKIMGQQGI